MENYCENYCGLCQSLIFPCPQSPGDENARLVPGEVKTQTKETRMDPKISPCDPNVIAFIHHNDIWVSNVSSKKEKRLSWTTFGKAGATGSVDQPISAGVPSFVVQEEFDRYTGYWWKPKTKGDNGNKYCILYEEVCDLCNYIFKLILRLLNPMTIILEERP